MFWELNLVQFERSELKKVFLRVNSIKTISQSVEFKQFLETLNLNIDYKEFFF